MKSFENSNIFFSYAKLFQDKLNMQSFYAFYIFILW